MKDFNSVPAHYQTAHFLKCIWLFCAILVFLSVLVTRCLATRTTLLLHHRSPASACCSAGWALAPRRGGTAPIAWELVWAVAKVLSEALPQHWKPFKRERPWQRRCNQENVKGSRVPSAASKGNGARKRSAAWLRLGKALAINEPRRRRRQQGRGSLPLPKPSSRSYGAAAPAQ